MKTILFLILLFIPFALYAQDIEINMQGKGEIICIEKGDTVYCISYGKQDKYAETSTSEPQNENSSSTKKNSSDYRWEGMPEKEIELNLMDAQRNENEKNYQIAFLYYCDAFESEKAEEMLNKHKESMSDNIYEISGLASMYLKLGMKDEYIETIKGLKGEELK